MIPIIVNIDGTFGQTVDALAACAALCRLNTDLQITVMCKDPKLQELVDYHWVNFKREKRKLEEATVVDLIEAREEFGKFELEYKKIKLEAYDKQIAMFAERVGASVDQIAKPADYEKLTYPDPVWNRANGYMYVMAETLKIENLRIPYGQLSDIEVPVSRDKKSEANGSLLKAKEIINPASDFILVTNISTLKDFGIKITYPSRLLSTGHQCVSLITEDVATPSEIVGLIANKRCVGVVSDVGEYGRAAAHYKKPLLVEFTSQPLEHYWVATRVEYSITVDLTNPRTNTETVTKELAVLYKLLFDTELGVAQDGNDSSS